jgi:hypothetical protein
LNLREIRPLCIFLTSSALKFWEVSNAGYSHSLCTNLITVCKCCLPNITIFRKCTRLVKKKKHRPLSWWGSISMLNVFENCSGAHHCSACTFLVSVSCGCNGQLHSPFFWTYRPYLFGLGGSKLCSVRVSRGMTNLNSPRSVTWGVEEIVEEIGISKGSCNLYVM